MDHPGVKSLLDRIFKQQKPAAPQSTADTEKQVSLKKFTEIDLNSGSTQAASFTRLTDFKDNLKQRMKARRCQIRKEEEEDNEMDEEYHKVVEKKDDDEELNSNSKEVKVIGDDEDEDKDDEDAEEEEEDEDGDASGDSDSNFKLNLNDDEEDEKEESKKKSKKSSAKTNKIDCYDFDEDDDDDELPDLRLKKNKSEIPLTNSIPSNQLTKDNLLKCNYNDFSTPSQDDPDHLFLEGTQFLVTNKQRRSLDELTNISFNYETASNHTNTNTNHHTPNTTSNSTNQNGSSSGKDASNKSIDNTLNEEVLFDELAMLCSGQFRRAANSQKNKATQNKE